MSKYVRWVNPNKFKEGDTLSIYRFNEGDQIDLANISGKPLHVYTEDKLFHVDTTSAPGVKHYYVVVHSRAGAAYSISNAVSVQADRDHGPGPDKLLWGDNNFGYYGLAEKATLDNTVDGPTGYIKAYRGAHKFVHNGRIIYVSPTATAVTYANALKYGMLSGGARPGIIEETFFTGEANVFHTEGANSYRIRLPKLFDRNNRDTDLSNYNTDTPYGISEYLDLRRFMTRNITGSAAWGNTTTVCESLSGAANSLTTVSAVSNTTTTAAGYTPGMSQNVSGLFVVEYCGKNPANFPRV